MPGQNGVTAGKLGLASVGAILLWSALAGKKWSAVLKDLIAGKSPKQATGTPIIDPESTLEGITSTNPFTGNTGPISSSDAANEAIVQKYAAQRGWTGAEWSALVQVLTRESGFQNNAQNPTSTAYGLFQFLDTTWAGFPYPKTSNPVDQTIDGLDYIAERYGNPSNALAHENAYGWY
jgi:Transglycosylase SLT domain